jgi:hypothetical protein
MKYSLLGGSTMGLPSVFAPIDSLTQSEPYENQQPLVHHWLEGCYELWLGLYIEGD